MRRTPEEEFMIKLAEDLPRSAASRSGPPPVALLGRQAARRFAEGEAPSLDQAVAEVAKESGLDQNHTRRVVESANQATWASEFHAHGNRHAAFKPADPQVVLGLLGQEEIVPAAVDDYFSDPPGSVTSPAVSLADLFGIAEPAEQEKVAHAKGAKVGWRDVAAADGVVSRHQENLDRLTFALVSTGEDLYGLVKQAHIGEGRGVLQIGSAIVEACESEAFGIGLVKQLAARLEGDGLLKFSDTQEKEKLAEVLVVDPEHPLLVAAVALEKFAATYDRLVGDHDAAKQHARALQRQWVQSARG